MLEALALGDTPSLFTSVLGGPDLSSHVPFSSDSLYAEPIPDLNEVFQSDVVNDRVGMLITRDSVIGISNPSSISHSLRGDILTYTIKEGDTISGIAAEFGISLDTVLGANADIRRNLIVPGQVLHILPVSGVLHYVDRSLGETAPAIAALYGVAIEDIQAVNSDLGADVLVIPGVKNARSSAPAPGNLPDLGSYFMVPTRGWNWGVLHARNAVDIANVRGTTVHAAAEGLVDYVGTGWDGGYGNNIIMEHPNGTKTRYAHLDAVSVFVGDYVLQGDVLGIIGNTGNTHGPTGYHLHFEIWGAKNPFVK